MPNFHFDLVDARTAANEDEDVQFCRDEQEARDVAHGIANRLAASEPDFLNGYCVLVSNAEGVEIYRAALGQPRDRAGH